MEYIDGTTLVVLDKYVIHKGKYVDCLIVAEHVWNDENSRACLIPLTTERAKIIVVKTENINIIERK